jgi:hypothetical protein
LPALIPSAGTIDLTIDLTSVAGAVGARNSHVRTQEHEPEWRVPAFGKNHVLAK